MFLMTVVAAENLSHNVRRQSTVTDELMQRVAQGDSTAFESLYTQTQTAVYGFALSILGNRQNAEDVMQDTYLTLLQKASHYQPQGKPMAWVLTITRNLAFMKLREGRRFEAPPEREPSSADFSPQALEKMVLHAALTVLSDEERQVVILHCVSGQKHREIAQLLGIPLGTALSKYRRALSKLQSCLTKEAHHEAH